MTQEVSGNAMGITSVETLGLKSDMPTKSSYCSVISITVDSFPNFNRKIREKDAPIPLKNPLKRNAVRAIVADQPQTLVIACISSFINIIANSVVRPMPMAVLIRIGHSIERMVLAIVNRVRINRLQIAVPIGQIITLRLYTWYM